jgi:hypothetical protein
MEEIWKDIKGTNGDYQVSSIGNIRSMPRSRIKKDGYLYVLSGRLLKPQNNKGYHQVSIRRNGKTEPVLIHRCVAMEFIPVSEGRNHINHKDGIKTNNRIDNLEWCTQYENNKHARDTGLNKIENYVHKRGEEHPMSKLDETQVKTILVCLKDGLTQQKIADYFKVDRSTIGYIKRGKLWAGLTQA